MKQNYRWTTRAGNTVDISLYRYGGHIANRPLVVYLHGFKGFKEWGFVPFTGETLARAGMDVLTLNFSHNGIGEDPLEFTEMEKFRKNTHSLELSEALEVLERIGSEGLPDDSKPGPIGVLGHSRGGGLALLVAQQSPHVKAVVTWAAVSTYDRFPDEVVTTWKERGYHEVVNSRTGQVFKMDIGLYEDIQEHKDGKLNILQASSELKKPLCIIHGDEDPAVNVQSARSIYERNEWGRCELHILSGADHVFGAKHPFQGSTEHFDEVLRYTTHFFINHLK